MDDRKSDALDCMYHITDVLWMDYGLKVSPTTEKDLYKNVRRGDIISDVIWKKIDEDECNLILEGIEDDLPDDIKNRRRYGGTPFNKSKKGRTSRTTSYFFDEKIFKEQDKCYKDCDNTYGKKATIPDKEVSESRCCSCIALFCDSWHIGSSHCCCSLSLPQTIGIEIL